MAVAWKKILKPQYAIIKEKINKIKKTIKENV